MDSAVRVSRDCPRLTEQVGDELLALVHELLARPAIVFGDPTAYSQKSGNAIVESQ